MKAKPVTELQLRAACAISNASLPYVDLYFIATRGGTEISITWRAVEGLCKRGLAKMIFRKQREKGRGMVIYLAAAQLTAAGTRLVKANPPICIGCGCTDAKACPGGCTWAAPGWCSACDETPERIPGNVA